MREDNALLCASACSLMRERGNDWKATMKKEEKPTRDAPTYSFVFLFMPVGLTPVLGSSGSCPRS